MDDRERARRRDALTDHLLHSLTLPFVARPFMRLNDLYHHFLIDVELDGCARTSRIVATNSSVQLYVHRAVMNLEQDRANKIDIDLDPEGIDEWQWRKNYRVWEANRKVFLYPENYIEPDLRDNKTPLFEELESTLLQQEINEDSVLDAYSSYMRGFDEVANLSIAGSFHDLNAGRDRDVLHLFGVSQGDSFSYYCRTIENPFHSEQNETRDRCGIVWNLWRKIDVQIPVRRVSPIILHRRIHLFWEEINTSPLNSDLEDGGSLFAGYKHTVSLKFSRKNLDGSWTAPARVDLSSPAFNGGDGVIEDPLLEEPLGIMDSGEQKFFTIRSRYGANKDVHISSKEKSSVQVKEETDDSDVRAKGLRYLTPGERLIRRRRFAKIRPLDGYTLKGFQWERVYPQRLTSAYDGRERVYVNACNFMLRSGIDFYRAALDQSYATSSIAIWVRILGWKHDSGVLYAGMPTSRLQSSFSTYAFASILADQRRITYYVRCLGSGVVQTQEELEEAALPLALEADCIAVDEAKAGKLDLEGPYGVYYREMFFHIPFLIANHLNAKQQFAAAQKRYHYIFDPTADQTENEDDPTDRNWRYVEFRRLVPMTLREQLSHSESIETYKRDPFNPHAIARLRLSAYQKSIVMKYIDNLLDWGDQLFAQDTMESINEATLLYVLASDILGERPAEIGECQPSQGWSMSYEEIARSAYGESELLMESFHGSREFGTNPKGQDQASTPSPVAVRSANERVSRRYEKARSRQTRNPATVMSTSTEMSMAGDSGAHRSALAGVTNSLGSESRFLMALEPYPAIGIGGTGILKWSLSLWSSLRPVFCRPVNENLLGYWDRVEDRLDKIRHCMNISGVRRELSLFAPQIDPMLLVRAKAAGLAIDEVLSAVSGSMPPYRFSYIIERAKGYAATLQGFGAALLAALEKKDAEELNQLRAVQQQNILKTTSQIKQWEVDSADEAYQAVLKRQESITYRRSYYQELAADGLSDSEDLQLTARRVATRLRFTAGGLDLLAGIFHLIPQLGSPFALTFGGREAGDSSGSWSTYFRVFAEMNDAIAARAGLEAGFDRRMQGWEHQFELANHELAEIEKQIEVATIRMEIAKRSKEVHEQAVEQQQEIYDFFHEKFSNRGLYTWLSATRQRLYRDAYNNAYVMAKLAEQAYRFERGDDAAELIGPNHWEASRAGLMAGECAFEVPEVFFDIYYPGHYRRRIKSVRLTIPCITGPYSNVSATQRLLGSAIRTQPEQGERHLMDVPVSRTTAIATSTAQNDAGVFELNFRDERYMPFEGAGAISRWQLNLPKTFKPFDYQTINDVILHVSYTAEEDEALRERVESRNGDTRNSIHDALAQDDQPLMRVISLRQKLSNELQRLLRSPSGTQVEIQLSHRYVPFFLRGEDLDVTGLHVVLRTLQGQSDEGSSETRPPPWQGVSVKLETTRSSITLKFDASEEASKDHDFGGLPHRSIDKNGAARLFRDGIGTQRTTTLLFSINPPGNLAPETNVSAIDPDKLTDIYVVLEYRLRLSQSEH